MTAQAEQLLIDLQNREGDRRLVGAAAQASEPAFKAVWDNDQDAAYDRL
jgi:hypothetical protein